MNKETRRYLSEIGRTGGKATSEAKRRAAKKNWKKAEAALQRKRSSANDKVERRAPSTFAPTPGSQALEDK